MDEFTAWFDKQPHKRRMQVACRGALRILPLAAQLVSDYGTEEQGVVLLYFCRAIAAAFVAGACASDEEIEELVKVVDAHDHALLAHLGANQIPASANARSEIISDIYSNTDGTELLRLALRVVSGENFVTEGYSGDLNLRIDQTTPQLTADIYFDEARLFATHLWHREGLPDWATRGAESLQKLSSYEKSWSFWREWYQGFLDGKPLDWELQKEIALIPDADWEEGPEWIAAKIKVIRTRRDLEAALTTVKDEITEQRATFAHRSHNQPPEMVDEVPQQLTIIWEHLGEIEKEIAKGNPAIETLRKLLLRTLAYAKAIGLYCASLGDAALKKAAEEIGSTGAKWVVRMTAAYFAVQTPPVQSGLQKVGSLLTELIKVLP